MNKRQLKNKNMIFVFWFDYFFRDIINILSLLLFEIFGTY